MCLHIAAAMSKSAPGLPGTPTRPPWTGVRLLARRLGHVVDGRLFKRRGLDPEFCAVARDILPGQVTSQTLKEIQHQINENIARLGSAD